MIRFITNLNEKADVEEIMGYVNDYINLDRLRNIENDSCSYSAQRECNTLFEMAVWLNENYSVSLSNPVTAQGRLIRLKICIKKVITKCIGLCFRVIMTQQTEFNANVVRYLNQERTIINKMNIEIMRLHEKAKQFSEVEKLPDDWYVDFENKFRGDTAVIKERLEKYVPLFADKNKVLDLGCGRGEFLQLLKENHIEAEGVDINEKMVEYCKEKELTVVKQDCLEFLKMQKKASIGGIFSSQLIEHLPKEKLYNFLLTAYNKLEIDGVLVLETVNPLTLGIFCYGFYIDPTHTVPVHPAMLRFMAEKIGFEVDPIEFINEFPEEYKFKIDDNMSQGELDRVNKLNEQLFGAQDYCMICRKR